MRVDPWTLLRARMADLRALQGAASVLGWDQEVYMPPRAAVARGEQLAALKGLHHEKLVAEDLADALAAAEEGEAGAAGHDPGARALLRALRRERERAVAVPERLVRELALAQASALPAWRAARQARALGAFAPELERTIALRRELAQCLLTVLRADARADAPSPEPSPEPQPQPQPYDALLDLYEEGLRVSRLEPLFARLAGWLTPLATRLAARAAPDPLAGLTLDVEARERLAREVLTAMGFDFEAGRLDRSVHPFCESADPGDVRLTIRHEEEPLSSVFSALHEGGHGLYEQGLPPEHRRDVLGAAAGFGLHESQSRLWENVVGRSLAFCRWLHPRLAAALPAAAAVTPEALYRTANRVAPGLIRVDADEVTYNLHVVLRFRLELALLRGDLRVADLPGAWSDGMEALLGLRPADDREGLLQDIHWAAGEIGYFPTYAVGNLYAATLAAAVRRDLPDLDARVAAGDLRPLREWLRDRVHRHGRAVPSDELVRRAAGRGLGDEDLRAYLESKHAA